MNMQEIQKAAEDKIGEITAASIEVMDLIAKAAWNEAIEAAAKCAQVNIDDCSIHVLIRKLKK